MLIASFGAKLKPLATICVVSKPVQVKVVAPQPQPQTLSVCTQYDVDPVVRSLWWSLGTKDRTIANKTPSIAKRLTKTCDKAQKLIAMTVDVQRRGLITHCFQKECSGEQGKLYKWVVQRRCSDEASKADAYILITAPYFQGVRR